ncbi:MAG: serine/threonine-protein kinase [Candidatus Sumerlaeia bacterium]|nr:serine/threonine-protein kinase [Candidatus Sumerlaeia bacterium]
MTTPPQSHDPSEEFANLGGLPAEATASYLGPPSAVARESATLGTVSLWAVPSAAGEFAALAPTEAAAPMYRLKRIVGRGGMGEVWEAEQVSLRRSVAVKRAQLPAGSGADDPRLAEFQREALISARLEHPNIVPVHDLGKDEAGRPLLAMKLVEGRGWDRALREEFGSLSASEFLAKHLPILIDVAQAVAFAHDRGVLHRDLKPSQVMLGAYGEVMLMDWGLAMYVGDAPDPDLARSLPTRATASSPSGTPALMAPEQTDRDTSRTGTWTDVYLLGGTLYYLLTGTFPHDAPTAAIAMAKARSGVVAPPRGRAPQRDVPADLEALCMESLLPDPAARLASAKEFASRLGDHLSGATRRRESQSLGRVVAEAPLESSRGYRAFVEAQSQLARARALWFDNPELDQLEERVAVAYAEAALSRRDLVLANEQAERLPPGAARSALARRVDAAIAAARRRELQRRASIAAVLVLAVVSTALAVWSDGLRRDAERARARADEQFQAAEAARAAASRERDAADAARLRAQDSRDRAEGLINFMLSDLRTGLAEVGRIDLLESVAARAVGFFEENPVAPEDPLRAQATRALALGSLAIVLYDQGKFEEADAAAAAAVEAGRPPAAQAGSPEDVAPLLAALDVRVRISQERVGVEEWRARLDAFEDAAASLPADLVRASTAYPRLAMVPRARAALRLFAGDTSGSLDIASAAFAEWDARLDGDPALGVPEYYVNLAELAVAAGDSRLLASEPDSAAGWYRRAAGIIDEGIARHPRSTSLIYSSTVSGARLGYTLQDFLGRTDEALEVNSRIAEVNRRLVELAPTNAQYHDSHAVQLVLVGYGLQSLGRNTEALESFRGAVAAQREALRFSPDTAPAKWFRLADRLSNLGQHAVAVGRGEEALACIAELDAIEDRVRGTDVWDAALGQAFTQSQVFHFALTRISLATVRNQEGSHREALALLEPVLRNLGGDPPPIGFVYPQFIHVVRLRNEAARACSALGDPARAAALVQGALAISNAHTASESRAGLPNERALQEALGHESVSHLLAAQAAALRGDRAAMEQSLAEALRLAPLGLPAWGALSPHERAFEAAAIRGDRAAALSALEQLGGAESLNAWQRSLAPAAWGLAGE